MLFKKPVVLKKFKGNKNKPAERNKERPIERDLSYSGVLRRMIVVILSDLNTSK